MENDRSQEGDSQPANCSERHVKVQQVQSEAKEKKGGQEELKWSAAHVPIAVTDLASLASLATPRYLSRGTPMKLRLGKRDIMVARQEQAVAYALRPDVAAESVFSLIEQVLLLLLCSFFCVCFCGGWDIKAMTAALCLHLGSLPHPSALYLYLYLFHCIFEDHAVIRIQVSTPPTHACAQRASLPAHPPCDQLLAGQ